MPSSTVRVGIYARVSTTGLVPPKAALKLLSEATPGRWVSAENCDYRADGSPVAWREVQALSPDGLAAVPLARLDWAHGGDADLMAAASDLAATVVEQGAEIERLYWILRQLGWPRDPMVLPRAVTENQADG